MLRIARPRLMHLCYQIVALCHHALACHTGGLNPNSCCEVQWPQNKKPCKKQLAKYRSRLRLLLFVSARQIVGRRLASLASAHESLEEALRLAGQTSVFSASAPNSPVVSHVADVWSPAELRSETAASGEHCHALHSLWLNTDQNSSCAFPDFKGKYGERKGKKID